LSLASLVVCQLKVTTESRIDVATSLSAIINSDNLLRYCFTYQQMENSCNNGGRRQQILNSNTGSPFFQVVQVTYCPWAKWSPPDMQQTFS